MTLSSSEADDIVLSDYVRDVRFFIQLLNKLGIDYHIPVVVKIDNVSTMFMAENISSSSRTRHIYVRLKFVNDFFEKGEITVVFVRLEDNDADVFTKITKA